MMTIILNFALVTVVILNCISYIRYRKIIRKSLGALERYQKKLAQNYCRLTIKTNEVIEENKFIVNMYKESDKKIKRLESIINRTKKFRTKKKLVKRIYSVN